MTNDEIKAKLFTLQDLKYRDFQSKLMPTVDKDTIIGVRTPELRKFAKELVKLGETESFLNSLPHDYYEENNLHGFIVSEIKDYAEAVRHMNEFLPYVDNWATCDSTSPKVFKKHKTELVEEIKRWLDSDKVYTIRFGVEMLMSHYLDDDFKTEYLEMVAAVRHDDYYVKMMAAWYFATALAKQYDSAIVYIENRTLEPWTHNKAIQKSVESYRITDEQKAYLKSLKYKNNA